MRRPATSPRTPPPPRCARRARGLGLANAENHCRPSGSTTPWAVTSSIRLPSCRSTTPRAPRPRSCARAAEDRRGVGRRHTRRARRRHVREDPHPARRCATVGSLRQVHPVRRRRGHAAGGERRHRRGVPRHRDRHRLCGTSSTTSREIPRVGRRLVAFSDRRSATSPPGRARVPHLTVEQPPAGRHRFSSATDLVKDVERLVRAYD